MQRTSPLTPMPRSPTRKSVRTSVIMPEDAHTRIQALAEANTFLLHGSSGLPFSSFFEEHGDEIQFPLKLPIMKKAPDHERETVIREDRPA